MSYPIDLSPNAFEKWALDKHTVWWAGNDQCVALVEAWIHNLRAPIIPCEKAFEIYKNAQPGYWIKIANTLNTIPVEGDIVVWQERIGSAGHTAIVRNKLSTVQYIYTIDQNWSKPRAVSFETHKYTAEHIEGFLRRVKP